MHVIKLDGYNATVDNGEKLELGTFDSYGEEQLQIVKAPDWKNLSVIATFNPPYKKPVQAVVDSVTGVIKVPKEATADSYGVGTIVFVGLADGVQRITSDVEYIVRRHSNASGTEPAEPTPDLLQQVLTLSKDAQTAAKNAVKDAAAAKANADKAAADAAKAGPYAEAARAAQEAAESARDEATAAQQAAENAAAAAAASKSAADTLAAEAARAAKAAEDSKAAANNSAYFAGENATAAQQAAATATAAANDAVQSASDAAASKAAAKTAAKAAQDAQTAAAAAKAEAVKAQGAAQTAAKSAQDAQAAAEKARDDAKTAQKGAEAARDTAAKSAEAAAKSEANAKQSAETLAESVENVVANTAAVAELKQQVKNITPDNSSIGEKPWSSKNIVDMLCPPLEESGNPVVCYPVAGYPLGVKASWEPMQEGSGDPSPENIRPIKGRDNVTVERCGENLINIKKLRTSRESRGITWTINDNGSVSVSGNSKAASYLGEAVYKLDKSKMILLTPGTYYFGGSSKTTSIYFYGFYEDGTPIEKQILSNTTYTIKSNLWLTIQGSIYPGTSVNETIYPIITFGNTAPTTYTPYNGQTNTLTLPETVYGGEVDAVTGEGQETWEMLTLDGTENWIKWESSNTVLFANALNDRGSIDLKAICSHIMTTKSIVAWVNLVNCMQVMDNAIGVNIAGKTEDVETWKSYLAAQYAAGTPVQICYMAAKPVPLTATGAQPLPALAGVNTVLTDANSATVTGRADPIKRITDLEAAVASIN